MQDYLKDTKACLTNDFSRYKRALTSVRQDLPDADRLGQVTPNCCWVAACHKKNIRYIVVYWMHCVQCNF